MKPAPPVLKASLIAWILWATFIVGVTVIHHQFAGAQSSSPLTGTPLRFLPLAPLALSIIVRFVMVPKAQNFPQGFPIWVVGLAMAEACGLLGTFLAPAEEARLLYFASVFGMALYVPKFVPFLRSP